MLMFLRIAIMSSAEAALRGLQQRPLRWLLATRPSFLTLTLAATLPGIAVAGLARLQAGWPLAVLAILLALLCHAAVNVINDVADHDNGSDAANLGRIYPFTGGSRFIQQAILSRRQMAALALGLIALVIIGGLYLVTQTGWPLLLTGFAGVLLGWGYSAPPLKLNSRGLGELAVVTSFALIPLGMLQVLGGMLSLAAGWLFLSTGLAAAALLFINQFPDREADALAGKRHWVVRLSPAVARTVYGLLQLAVLSSAAAGLLAAPLGLLSLLPLALLYGISWRALRDNNLRTAIVATIMAANLHPVLLALAWWLA